MMPVAYEPRGHSNGPIQADDPDDLVARFVRPGDHVHLAATLSRPNALLAALARVFRHSRSLTVSTTAIHSSAHALALSGAVGKVITGFVGDTYPSPRPNRLYRDLANGEPFEIELWSLLTYTQRLIAAALGQPYATTGSQLAETDLRHGKDGLLHVVADPAATQGADREVALIEPLRPDWALFHGVMADRHGNVVACPPFGEGMWAAYAATRGVLASVEAIVDGEVIAEMPERVVFPASRVVGICEAPFGAHPQSLRTNGLGGIAGYLDDFAHLEEIVHACRTPEGAAEWFDTWVGQLSGHGAYVEQLGQQRRQELTGAGTWRPPAATAPVDLGAATEQERLIILGARAIADAVQAGGYDTLLAGIGASHMAAWLAAQFLAERGTSVHVAAELGFLAMDPEPGDVFLFSQRHADRSQMLASVAEVLGGTVAANPRCLGVLAAAEVDEDGNLNTTVLPNGRWVTGSGGANDIASTTDCLVIAAATPRRYVSAATHVTSPGQRVREVVSQFGRFRRPSAQEAFALTTWLPFESADAPATPQQAVERLTGWSAKAAEVTAEEPISPAELAALRRLDPEGAYR